MKAFRVNALIVSAVALAVIVSPALASGPALSPTAAPSADAPSVTATGIGATRSSAADPLAMGQTLYVGVQTTSDAAGMQQAADDLLARLDSIRAALVAAGVAADGIRTTGFNVSPSFGPMKPGAAEVGQPQVTSLTLNSGLSADVPSIRLVVAAMNAATSHGATTVNVNSGKGATPGTMQPSAADLAKATEAAVANARITAEALAAASGKRLGGIRSISSQAPMFGCCPPNPGWTVQVTVTFDIAAQ